MLPLTPVHWLAVGPCTGPDVLDAYRAGDGRGRVEFRVLGAVELWALGRVVPAGPPLQRVVLALLAAQAGRPVPVEILLDEVWGDAAPGAARRGLHAYVAHLRRVLDRAGGDPDWLVRRSGGYVLDVDPDRVDLHRFRRLIRQARQRPDPDGERLALLREAVDLWRGEPLAGLPGEWAARTRAGWQQERQDALVAWADAERLIGDPAAVIGPLAAMVAQFPLVEPLAAALIRALHLAGRSAEALACYAAARERLVADLGIEPGADLRAAHQEILRSEPAVHAVPATPAPAAPAPGPAGRVPAQLPPDIPRFVARAGELAEFEAILANAADSPSTVVIFAVSGTAGVGKTALAVHWAHLVRDRYPDGQLYVNLRGFDPGGAVTDPAEALAGFLDALGVPPQRVPADLAPMAGLYRSLLAGRRVLVVLDNARDADQVRALLPGTPGCQAVVTSRNDLRSLVAIEGAHAFPLDLLSDLAARELLAGRLGEDRLANEPEAVDKIIHRCSRLPLALSIVAARAATQPAWPLSAIAGELADAGRRLDVLRGGDWASDVGAAFSWSYRAVDPTAARLFRLLSLHPGPDITVPAAASLAGAVIDSASRALAELARACLVIEQAPGRFGFHDLLRAYATELAHQHDPTDHLEAARGRLLDHYLHSAYAADRLLNPHRDPIALAGTGPGVAPERPDSHDAALAWFTAERASVLAIIGRDPDRFDAHTWQLAWCVTTFLQRQGHWRQQVDAQLTALAAAERQESATWVVACRRALAAAYGLVGAYSEAESQYHQALAMAVALNRPADRAACLFGLGWIAGLQDHHREAIGHYTGALEGYRATDNTVGQGRALNAIGWCHVNLGEYPDALTACLQALDRHRDSGDRYSTAETLDTLGYIHHQQGQHRQALDCYRRSVHLHRELGDRYQLAETLTHVGDTHSAVGEQEAAEDAWRTALEILTELDHPDAAGVRRRLAG